MLCTFLLFTASLPQSQTEQPDWKKLALSIRDKLIDEMPEAVASLKESDLKVRRNEDAGGGLVFVEKDSIFHVGIRTRDKSFSTIRLYPDPVPYTDDVYPVEDAVERAKELVRVLRPEFSDWSVDKPVYRSELLVSLNPIVKGLVSEEWVCFYFRKSDGQITQIVGTNTLDYTRPFGEIVTREQAIASAWDAYLRWQPFPAGRIASARLLLGRLTIGYFEDFSPHELTANELALANAFVAVPVYSVAISWGHSTWSVQMITVDAQTGEAKTITPWQGPLGGEIIKDKTVGKGVLSGRVGTDELALSLDAAEDAVATVRPDLAIVPFVIGSDTYSARLDVERSVLWIGSENKWHPYSLDERSLKVVKAAVVKREPFGKKTDG